MKKMFCVCLFVFPLLWNTIPLSAIQIQTTNNNNSIFVGQLETLRITGLTADQMYVVDYDIAINNVTFQASGYAYEYSLQINQPYADNMTASLYETDTTGINTSVLLSSVFLILESYDDYNYFDIVVDLLWLFPVIVVGIAVGVILRFAMGYWGKK